MRHFGDYQLQAGYYFVNFLYLCKLTFVPNNWFKAHASLVIFMLGLELNL